ncbi:hypothetical protein [Halobellus inordinatus]|uniref:hypothetical protein n=1 Tax=Halobellus inordinatus TaxID=1126236 RepID=UPI002108ABC3|nr:hypothetical protein [Halobellus inordinatus]
MTGPSLSRRSLLRGGAAAGLAALAGCGAVAAAGPWAVPVPDGVSHQDVAVVRPPHRDVAIEHLRDLLERAEPIVERARSAGVFEGERFLGYEGSVASAREFLDGSHAASFDTISEARYHVRYVAETFGVAAAGLDDVSIELSGAAQTGPAAGIEDLRGTLSYESDGPAETMVWIDLVESWLHAAVIAGKNAEVDRDELAEKPERVRKKALARAVRNHERSVRFLSDARQFYRTFRARQSAPASIGLTAAREAYRERAQESSHDNEWYHERHTDEETPRDTAWNRLLTLHPGENSLDDAEWARRDGLSGLETVQLAEAAVEFQGFSTGRDAVERLRGRQSVPKRLLFDAKRRAVDGAYRIAAAGDPFEKWLLRRAAMYLSKGDRFLTDGEILDNYPRAHALACYGVAVGVVDAIPSVASVVTD